MNGRTLSGSDAKEAPMELLVAVLTGWAALSVVAVVGAAAVCRAGHVEDVARGFAEPDGTVPARRAG